MEPATEKQVSFAKNLNCWQEGMTKQECRLAIDRALGAANRENIHKAPEHPEGITESPKPEIVRPADKPKNGRNPYDKDPVGLAVEVFCAIFASQPYGKSVTCDDWTIEDWMKKAIELVKQAKEAFE